MGDFASIVSTLGFPIAMCCYMVYNSEKNHKRHSEETAKLTELINNNTIALTRLAERLERYEMIPNGFASEVINGEGVDKK